jgi:outer membrane protein OmpA-like peptidoglycan-associated protein
MRTKMIAGAIALLAATACAASTPTPELVSARQAYDRARTGPDAQLDPDVVLSAKQSLDTAESVHNSDPGSDREKSYSYVAERRAELAIVDGQIARDKQDRADALKRYSDLQNTLRVSANHKLDDTRTQVQQLNGQLTNVNGRLSTEEQNLAAEKLARKAAEDRAKRAMESLEKIAMVKEEARGTVITLSGQVLFVTGKSELLPAARDQLEQVAKALADQGDMKPAVIEGYTDSRGSKEMNLKLSQDRADAVRSFLISKGVAADKLTAVGKGDASPVATNDTPEGRANNRRVEIIVGNGDSRTTAR